MKRCIAMLLCLAIMLAFSACGSSAPATEAPAPQAPAQDTLDLGATVDTGFVKFSFDSALVYHKVGGEKGYRPAPDGMQYFILQGTIQNVAGSEMKIYQLSGEMTFGGTYTYTASGAVSYGDGYETSLPPLMEGRFLIFAEVPDALMDQLTDCSVTFSFNEEFAEIPAGPDKGDYCYNVYLDESVCAAALEGPEREMVYFAECPILPTPASFSDTRQASRSSSSSNGKVTSIRYSFTVGIGGRDDIYTVYDQYVAGLEFAGFTVQTNDQGAAIYSGAELLAEMRIENGNAIHFDIVPGNEDLTAPAAGVAPAAGESTDIPVELGSPIENNYAYLLLEKADSTQELRSGSSSYGTYHYYTSDSGDPYFYLEGTFKNLGGAPVDIRNAYISFTFDGKYTYKGEMDGFIQGNWGFVHDIAPLSSVCCYVYAAVPQELIDSYSTCQIRIGFTEDFNYKTVDVNDLPKFNYCDDVYTITLTR